MAPEPTESTPVATYTDRLTRLAEQAGVSGADVILITPGPDLEYFIGHSVGSHERLTCLVVPAAASRRCWCRPWSGRAGPARRWRTWASRSAPGPTARTRTARWPTCCRPAPGCWRSTTTCPRCTP